METSDARQLSPVTSANESGIYTFGHVIHKVFSGLQASGLLAVGYAQIEEKDVAYQLIKAFVTERVAVKAGLESDAAKERSQCKLLIEGICKPGTTYEALRELVDKAIDVTLEGARDRTKQRFTIR